MKKAAERFAAFLILKDCKNFFSDIESCQLVKLYPNPASEVVNIALEGEDQIKGLKLVDLKGRLLLKKDYIQNTGAVMLDISGISPGVYIIEINGQYAEQLVKY